jgi:hypothetical protein
MADWAETAFELSSSQQTTPCFPMPPIDFRLQKKRSAFELQTLIIHVQVLFVLQLDAVPYNELQGRSLNPISA